MTDDQINAAIAEACGWKGNVLDRDMEGNLWPSDPPQYCKDLNAMHEAEKMLTTDQFYAYSAWIDKLAPKREYRAYLGATARHRAEAFLRTLGKWEEEQQ